MRIALIQLAYGEGAEESVEERAARAADLVRNVGHDHDLVVLPELWSAGGFAIDDWQERSQDLEAVRAAEVGEAAEDGAGEPEWPPALAPLAAAAREAGVVLHAGSVVERTADPGEEGRHLSNTSVVLGPDGRVCATYRKIHRFGFGSGEPRLMEAGAELVITDLPAPADALTVGLSTCYDLRFPELYRAQLDLGAEIFVVPAAWPAARVEAWRLLARARAIEDQCFVLACNTAGTHAGVEMGGHSAVIDPWGTVLAEAGTEQEILSVQIDPGAVVKAREQFPVLADRRL
ncbi:carbon-nitrogen family hydrolase [Ornithinimicrobium pratense]|uniref:Carbon-nitrogen family hydrolase n=1 Tax=Ornithinimicrobium pratense TaxID=2593973 RepID=A0A5J6V7E5_9MICO|nr:carbon-nitrogen family hydrolase [Ornithinimicrobium pratense]QFG69678.1 carbon-nitrogen family hydrolase [Ornithinimicrobium pratense]